MKLLRLPLALATTAVLAACSMPNPYSSQPAPVSPRGSEQSEKAPNVKPAPKPPVKTPTVELPDKPVTPLPDMRSADLEQLVDGLSAKLKNSGALNEVAGPVLLDNIRNQAGSPIDTSGLTSRLRASLSGQLNFADGDKVSSLRQQLAYQGGRADVASLVRLGKQSGADYLLSTDLTRNGRVLNLKGQLMELGSGEVLWSDSVRGR